MTLPESAPADEILAWFRARGLDLQIRPRSGSEPRKQVCADLTSLRGQVLRPCYGNGDDPEEAIRSARMRWRLEEEGGRTSVAVHTGGSYYYLGRYLEVTEGLIQVKRGVRRRKLSRMVECEWRERDVFVVIPRVRVPWFGVGLLLGPDCVAIFGAWELRQLERRLRDAGFVVHRQRTLISLGGPRSLARARRAHGIDGFDHGAG